MSDDRSLRVWKLAAGGSEQLRELYGHRSRIWAVRETKNYFATVSEDTTCKLWHKSSADLSKPFDTLKGHSGKNVRALACFSDHEYDLLATGGEDGAIKVFDIKVLENTKKN